jgi:putative ABC transport system permease protein
MKLLAAVWSDAKLACRSFRRNVGFSAAIVATLAFGIAATTAVYSVVSATLLRPLPYEHPDDLVVVWQEYASRGWGVVPFSQPNFVSVARQARGFRGLAGAQYESLTLTGVPEPEALVGVAVSRGAFQVLGVRASLGRTLTEADADPNAERTAVLSDGLWRRRFGADRNVIGQSLLLSGQPVTVVGVMPPDFGFPLRFRTSIGGAPFTMPAGDVWIPLSIDARPQFAGTRNLFVIGRVAEGSTLETVRQEMAAVAPRLLEEFTGPANTGLTIAVRPLHEEVAGNVRTPLLLLLGAVALVVLIACANVASMLMARGVARRDEMALRAAIGASRAQLIRQVLVESLLLASISGGAAALLTSWITRALSISISSKIPQVTAIPLDAPVFLFGIGLTLGVGLLVGAAPAVKVSSVALREQLSGSTARGLFRVRQSHGRVLLTCEAACSVVLLVAAGLLARSFYSLVSVDPGFEPSHTLASSLDLPVSRYQTNDQRRLFHQQLVSRLRGLPGVEAVGITNRIPLTAGSGTGGLTIEGRDTSPEERPHAAQRIVDAGYFPTMRIDVVRGRGFEAADRVGSPAVAVVNETASRQFWPGDEDPIGQRIRPDGVRDWLTIVGVVEDVRHASIGTAAQPEVYWPFPQRPLLLSPAASSLPIGVVVRSEMPADILASAVRREVRAIDANLPVTLTGTFEDLVSESLAETRLYATVMGLFAIFGLLVAATGLYGVVSFLVAQRRLEIGVRVALGALQRQVILMIVREGVIPVIAGALIGIGIAVGGRQFIRSLLYEVTATDPLTLAAVPLLLFAVAVCASYIPARRAARVDPVVTLRTQ